MTQDSTRTGPQFRAVGNGCRIIDVRPSHVRDGRLQQLIDVAATGRTGNGGRVTIRLQPGRYALKEPIVLREQHSNLTLRGCSEAAVISAVPGFEKAFAQGLIVLAGVNKVTITGLELELPLVPATLAQVRASQQQDKPFAAAVNAIAANRSVSIGIRPVHCAALTITNCLFQFSLGAQVITPEAAPTTPATVFGVGVFAASDCAGLQLKRNRFLCNRAPRLAAEGAQHAPAGYLPTPATVAPADGKNAFRQFNGSQAGALLHDADIRDNTFDGHSAAAVLADLGTIQIWDNIIRRSCADIWLTHATVAALTDLGGTFSVPGELKDQASAVRAALATGQLDPVLLLLTVFGLTFPLPDLGTPTQLSTPAGDPAATQELQAAGEQVWQEWMTRFVDVVAGLTPTKPPRRRTDKAAAPDASTSAIADFNQGIGGEAALLRQGTPIQQQLQVANAGLAALARLVDIASQSTLMLGVERNDVECELKEPTNSGPATFVYVSPRNEVTTSAEINGNRMSSTGATPAAALLGVASLAITGKHRHYHEREGVITNSCRLLARLRSPATS